MLGRLLRRIDGDERGHAGPLPAFALVLAGAIGLGIGAAADIGWLAIVAGVALGLGVVGISVLNHMKVEYDIFARLDKLEKK